jgi:hypothetical protein
MWTGSKFQLTKLRRVTLPIPRTSAHLSKHFEFPGLLDKNWINQLFNSQGIKFFRIDSEASEKLSTCPGSWTSNNQLKTIAAWRPFFYNPNPRPVPRKPPESPELSLANFWSHKFWRPTWGPISRLFGATTNFRLSLIFIFAKFVNQFGPRGLACIWQPQILTLGFSRACQVNRAATNFDAIC